MWQTKPLLCYMVTWCVFFLQVLSIIVISFVGHFSDQSVNQVPIGLWFMVGVTGLGCLVTVFVRPKLRRVKIDENK